jgi:Tfp pilus assembly protein PilN
MSPAPKKREIELLPQEDWEKTSWGKLLKWTLSVGRYIVIVTELIVIVAFVSRFKLDHDLTNLNEEIKEKQARIEAMSEFEKEFRFLQKRLQTVSQIQGAQKTTSGTIQRLIPLIPIDVSLTSLSVNEKTIDLSAVALSAEGLASFINNLKESPHFNQLNLQNVSTGTEQLAGIQFNLSFVQVFEEDILSQENNPKQDG